MPLIPFIFTGKPKLDTDDLPLWAKRVDSLDNENVSIALNRASDSYHIFLYLSINSKDLTRLSLIPARFTTKFQWNLVHKNQEGSYTTPTFCLAHQLHYKTRHCYISVSTIHSLKRMANLG